MNVTQRLVRALQEKGISIAQLERTTGTGSGTIRKAIEGDRSISSGLLQKILETIPELNMNWLLSGLGTMFLNAEMKEGPSVSLDRNWPEKYVALLEKYTALLERVDKPVSKNSDNLGQ